MKKPLLSSISNQLFYAQLILFGLLWNAQTNAAELGPISTTIVNEALYIDLMLKDGVLHLVWVIGIHPN